MADRFNMGSVLKSAGRDEFVPQKGKNMRMRSLNGLLIGMALAMTLACNETKAPDVTENLRHALDAAGLSDVHVSQDRDKNVVTLSGSVPSDDDKGRAESIAESQAGSAVVADEIGVRPKDDEGTARKVDSDVDSGIEKNLDAMLVGHKVNHAVRYYVKNEVVTLKGSVPSQA